MPSVALDPAAPAVGAADRLAALRATMARLDAPAAPAARPAPVPVGIDPAAVAARHALARAHAAYFDARAARYALRDECRPGPDRFAQLRAVITRCREARAAYAAAAAAFHASPAGAALQAARAKCPVF